ncbi:MULTISPECIES: GtrA family protein [Oerskovia]|uniref:GtrA family protein n=1 Tax=Oerskovia rustica TaxID=2762237 RepID=A0ABR8RMN6_9CELL|nr:GtrA family protein [Oerskovia rustica]MBD7948927.1 GtrA family protein [Oerskovia rustica]
MSSQVDELSLVPVRAPVPAGTAARPTSGAAPRRTRVVARLAELGRFSFVGTVAFFVDLGLFNLLRFGPWDALSASPLEAKAIAVSVATVVSWLGSRYWTFSDRRTSRHGRELLTFLLVNAAGMAISLGVLAFTTSILGLTSPLAENVAANGVGLALANVFRYVAYRRVVFTGSSPAGRGQVASTADENGPVDTGPSLADDLAGNPADKD